MTKRDLAKALAKEMVEDFLSLGRQMEAMYDRWSKYGPQFGKLLSQEELEELDKELLPFYQTAKKMMED